MDFVAPEILLPISSLPSLSSAINMYTLLITDGVDNIADLGERSISITFALDVTAESDSAAIEIPVQNLVVRTKNALGEVSDPIQVGTLTSMQSQSMEMAWMFLSLCR